MAFSSSSSKPLNNERENTTDESNNIIEKKLIKDTEVWNKRNMDEIMTMTMLHQSSGRRNFNLVKDAHPVPSYPAQKSNFFVRLRDQIKEAITRADKQEATKSSLE